MATLLGTLLLGLCTGSIYALVALGYTLLFQSATVIDFSRGPLVMVGAIATAWIEVEAHIPWPLALAGCIVAGALLGALQYLLAVAPLGRGDRVGGSLVATLGFGLVVTALLTVVFGSQSRGIPALIPGAGFSVGGISFEPDKVAVIAVAVLSTLLLWLGVQRTTAGRQLRAVAEEPEAAALRGINVRVFAVGSFVAAGALAAATGFIIAPALHIVLIAEAPKFTIYGFVAMIVGGTGSLWGALAGGFIVGLAEELGAHYVAANDINARYLFGLAVLVVVLLVRPQGVFASQRLRRA